MVLPLSGRFTLQSGLEVLGSEKGCHFLQVTQRIRELEGEEESELSKALGPASVHSVNEPVSILLGIRSKSEL